MYLIVEYLNYTIKISLKFLLILMVQINDEMRQRLIKSVSGFRDVRLKTDHDIALLARNDKIDIVVDLKGYTKGEELEHLLIVLLRFKSIT